MSESKEIKYVNFGVGYSVYKTTVNKKFEERKKFIPNNPKLVEAFIPGTIVEIKVEVGDDVKVGTPLLILEAMKMKNKLTAVVEGKVKAINVEKGQRVTKNQVLIELE